MNSIEAPFTYSVNQVAQQFLEVDFYQTRFHRKDWNEALALLRPYRQDYRSFLGACRTTPLINPPLVFATLIVRDNWLIKKWSDAQKRCGLYVLTGEAALHDKNLLAERELGINNYWDGLFWYNIKERLAFFESRQAQLLEKQTPIST